MLPLPEIAGRLVIEERSRCDNNFPMQLSGDSYWQDCVRRRSPSYSASDPLAYDFAQYDCPGTAQGSCSYVWPASYGLVGPSPAPPPPVGAQPPDGSVPPHGLCNGGVPAIAWMGMTSYSQFMCAQISNAVQNNNDVLGSQVYSATQTNAPWEALNCVVAGQSPTIGGPGTTASFSCAESQNGAMGPVTWLARRYQDYSTPAAYSGGCIDEATEYPALCLADPTDAVAISNGQLTCGPPCPDGEEMDGGGFVMCLHPTLACLPENQVWSVDSFAMPTWQLAGEVSLGGTFGSLSGCDANQTNCWDLQ
jgi:hypothetical protein